MIRVILLESRRQRQSRLPPTEPRHDPVSQSNHKHEPKQIKRPQRRREIIPRSASQPPRLRRPNRAKSQSRPEPRERQTLQPRSRVQISLHATKEKRQNKDPRGAAPRKEFRYSSPSDGRPQSRSVAPVECSVWLVSGASCWERLFMKCCRPRSPLQAAEKLSCALFASISERHIGKRKNNRMLKKAVQQGPRERSPGAYSKYARRLSD